MTDWIHIRDLTVECIIGVNPKERRSAQIVVLNIRLETDLSKAARTDRLEHTVDYRDLKQRIVRYVRRSRHRLLERLAEAVAAICLRAPRVQAVGVTVDKPGALTLARSVAVEIRRERPARTARRLSSA